jgi:hypothetical protein
MAYNGVPTYHHGDRVYAADLQKYSDGLNAIKPMFPDEKESWAHAFSTMAEAQSYFFTHKRRWLIYKSTGVIHHPTDPVTYPDVSLSDSDDINAVDIDAEVSWLIVGQLYQVIGCSVAFEDDEGIIA